MAIGSIKRFPQKNPDGTITTERMIRDENGNFITITEEVQEVGGPSSAVGKPAHIVEISDQLQIGKYNYLFKDLSGNQKASSNIYRVFYNGVNMTSETTLSSDGLSFSFSSSLPEEFFSTNEVLIIDFVER